MKNVQNTSVFYGAAIQGALDRGERADLHNKLMKCIEEQGFKLVFDHTRAKHKGETKKILDQTFGDIPSEGIPRRRFIRNKMIEGIEGTIKGAIFEVSTPSLGTGVEVAHAYLRPRMGLSAIPILLLYQKDFWPHNLSTMLLGISPDEYPNLKLVEYKDLKEALIETTNFLQSI